MCVCVCVWVVGRCVIGSLWVCKEKVEERMYYSSSDFMVMNIFTMTPCLVELSQFLNSNSPISH